MDEPFAGADYFNRMDFYKVLLGEFWSPRRPLFLSTHLVEEMAPFLGRAILLHQGSWWPTPPPQTWRRRAPTW